MPDIEQKCKITGQPFVVTHWEQEFLQKMGLPLPTLCIEERHRRRLAHRNERRLYKDKCGLTGQDIISIYSPDKGYTVYSQEAWWSDKWDARDYGRDFDFNRPFFDQFAELQKAVPRLALMNIRGENSEYCNTAHGNKNCYLVFGGDYSEDCMFSIFSMYSKDCVDVYMVNKCELLYDCVDCNNCYNIKYSRNSYNCRDSNFLFECRNCQNCFGCIGIVNKQYHIFNKAYSKEEYEKKIKEFRLDSWPSVQKLKADFEEFSLQFPHRANQNINSENVSGDRIVNGKNCFNCFDIQGPAEDFKDVLLGGWDARDIVSSDHAGFKSELFYEMVGSIEGYNCALSTFSWSSKNVMYCDVVMNSNNLFGCSSLNQAEYCILNKQYSQEEYFDLKNRIIEHMKKNGAAARQAGEWGEFFPINNSLFGYNETAAQDFFPLSKKEAAQKGYKWHEEEVFSTSNAQQIPDSIHDVKEDILNLTLICEQSGRPYKIIPQELKYYQKMVIPIPRHAPETRNVMRIQKRNPIKTWPRACQKCGSAIDTSFAPLRPEKIYCEKCYLQTTYS